MPRRDVIVLGGSAGGLHPVRELLSLLPAGLRATVFIGLHRSGVAEQYPDALQEILARKAPFRVVLPKDGQAIEPGCAYLTPRGCGLIIETENCELNDTSRIPVAQPVLMRFSTLPHSHLSKEWLR
jgi:two-component system chemotaxis response regulator CheB